MPYLKKFQLLLKRSSKLVHAAFLFVAPNQVATKDFADISP